jgi:hypothetical protein
MARVEWAALSGDEVETVLSNLLYNTNERALRIRPSQSSSSTKDWVANRVLEAARPSVNYVWYTPRPQCTLVVNQLP